MKLRIMSDLHLEFDREESKIPDFYDRIDNVILPSLPDDSETILILAGDIDKVNGVKFFVKHVANRFRAVLHVMGNHEHYGGNLPTTARKIEDSLADVENYYLLDDESIEFDGIYFVGSTLWTDLQNIDPLTLWWIHQNMSDYKMIRSGPPNKPWKHLLKPVETSALHRRHKEYLFPTINNLKARKVPVVVITHHLPSMLCVSDYHKNRGNEINENAAYVTELFEHIADSKPDLWIHGHTHNNVDVMVHETRTVCNPRGYFPTDLNKDFDPMFMVEINEKR